MKVVIHYYISIATNFIFASLHLSIQRPVSTPLFLHKSFGVLDHLDHAHAPAIVIKTLGQIVRMLLGQILVPVERLLIIVDVHVVPVSHDASPWRGAGAPRRPARRESRSWPARAWTLRPCLCPCRRRGSARRPAPDAPFLIQEHTGS